MARFYQRKNPNSQSSLFHHGLIRVLVISHLSKAGDNWKKFLIRNGFVPLTPEPISDSPLCLDEPTIPCPSTHSLQDLHVKLQEDPALFTETPIDFNQSTRDKH
jgi:hypothetical protein